MLIGSDKYQKTLNAIFARLDRLGDLPVFSASVNRIRQISSSKESDAMELAMAVMKDANLSAKLLKLANASYYKHGTGQVNRISRAVVQLGFDRIKSLSVTLKLIESFSNSNPGIDIGAMLMRAFVNATMVREIASKAGVDDIEETYTCGLLYNLGEIVIAYTLPERYQEMERLRSRGDLSWEAIQEETLGGLFCLFGQDLAQGWGFPKTVVRSMNPEPSAKSLSQKLPSLSNQLLELVYDQGEERDGSFADLIDKLEKRAGLSAKKIHESLKGSFKMTCDMAQEYGMSTKHLVPPVRSSGDDELDDFTEKIAYYVRSREQANADAASGANGSAAAPAQSTTAPPHAGLQLEYLQHMADLVTQQAPVHQVLRKAVEAIERSTGCHRAAFVMLSKDLHSLNLRISEGEQISNLADYFQLSWRNKDDQLFFKLVQRGMTLLVTDVDEGGWCERLPDPFLSVVNPQGFILAPLVVGNRTIGFLYADRLHQQGAIDDDDFRGFNQFFMQAKLALSYSQQNQNSHKKH